LNLLQLNALGFKENTQPRSWLFIIHKATTPAKQLHATQAIAMQQEYITFQTKQFETERTKKPDRSDMTF